MDDDQPPPLTSPTAYRAATIRVWPYLYAFMMILACGQIALALNFWNYKPTFNPYNMPKTFVGAVFCALGVSHIVIISAVRTVRAIRWMLWTSFVLTFFWALSNTQQFREGKASLQLPILLTLVSAWHVPLAFMTVVLAVRKR